MSGLSLGIIVEALVSVLLVATIGYCVAVNRKLEALRSDNSELRVTIRELQSATGHAERAIAYLRETAATVEETLAERISRAEKLQARLDTQTEQGETLLSRLSVIAEARAATPPQFSGARPPDPSQCRPHFRHSEVGLGLLNAEKRGAGGDGPRKKVA